MNHHKHVVIKSYLLIVFFWKYTRKALYVVQGCQLPDFSLRTQIFCYTVDFPMTFLYEFKTTTYFASHHKTTSKHPRIPVFYFILQNILLAQTKKGKSASLPLAPPVPGQACSNAYVKHFAKSSDFFETQCWQHWCIVQLYLIVRVFVVIVTSNTKPRIFLIKISTLKMLNG